MVNILPMPLKLYSCNAGIIDTSVYCTNEIKSNFLAIFDNQRLFILKNTSNLD